jgi:hypothetical protein
MWAVADHGIWCSESGRKMRDLIQSGPAQRQLPGPWRRRIRSAATRTLPVRGGRALAACWALLVRSRGDQ